MTTYPLKIWDGSQWRIVNKTKGADGVGLPAGGDAGQVLVKGSAADYDLAWASAAGGAGVPSIGHNPVTAGMLTSGHPTVTDLFNGTVPQNTLLLAPFIPSKTFTADDIGNRINNATAGTYLLGVYGSDANDWVTGDPLFQVSASTSVSGVLSVSITPFQFQEGVVYWCASMINGASANVGQVRRNTGITMFEDGGSAAEGYTHYRFPYTWTGTLPNAESSGLATFNASYLYAGSGAPMTSFRVASVP